MSSTFQRINKCYKVLLLVDNVPHTIYQLPVKDLEIFGPHDSYDASSIDGIIIFHSKDLNKINLDEFKNIKVIKTITAGTDHIPEDIKRKYRVLGTHGPNAKYIAEHGLALALACARKLAFHTTKLKEGEFHQTDMLNTTLFKSNVLILGFGPIGRYTAGLFKRTFDARITIFKSKPVVPHLYRRIVNTIVTDFEELLLLLLDFNIIINTLPLTENTENLINESFFMHVRDDVIIINVSRGKIVSEKALFNFLKTHKNACAGIDVWYAYPKKGSPFRQHFPFEQLDNIVMTPHNAPVVKGYFYNMLKSAIYQIKWDLEKINEGH